MELPAQYPSNRLSSCAFAMQGARSGERASAGAHAGAGAGSRASAIDPPPPPAICTRTHTHTRTHAPRRRALGQRDKQPGGRWSRRTCIGARVWVGVRCVGVPGGTGVQCGCVWGGGEGVERARDGSALESAARSPQAQSPAPGSPHEPACTHARAARHARTHAARHAKPGTRTQPRGPSTRPARSPRSQCRAEGCVL